MEVVESGGKNIEIAVVRRGEELTILDDKEVDVFVKEVEEEQEKEKKKKKK